MPILSTFDRTKSDHRTLIKKILQDTYFLEYPDEFPANRPPDVIGRPCKIRHYKMTKDEHEKVKGFTLTVLVEDVTSDVPFCEGFCYNVLELVRNKYLVLDGGSDVYVPIPLSRKRWDFVNGIYPKLSELTRGNPGTLMYPLLRSEVLVLLDNLHHQPIVCSTLSGCKRVSMDAVEPNTYRVERLFDVSDKDRYGPPTPVFSRGDHAGNPVLQALLDKEMSRKTRDVESRVKIIIDMTEKELLGVFPKEFVDSKIKSPETRAKVRRLIMDIDRDDSQAQGLLVDEIIRSALEKKTTPFNKVV